MNHTSVAIALFYTHSEAEEAVRELQKAGFDMKKLSVAGKDHSFEEHVVGFYHAGDQMKFWRTQDLFLEKLLGAWSGAAFFWDPEIGPLVVGGPSVSWIVEAWEGPILTGGLTAVGARLCSTGIPKDNILQYETLLKADKFMLIVHGNAEETEQAYDILDRSKGMVESSLHHGISV